MLAELELEALDLPETSMDILKLLSTHPELPIEEVKNRIGIASPSRFDRAVSVLAAHGLVSRHSGTLRLKEAR